MTTTPSTSAVLRQLAHMTELAQAREQQLRRTLAETRELHAEVRQALARIQQPTTPNPEGPTQ
jgi:hypothetical protein